MKERLMVVGWSSFLMACVLEALVFSMVDPASVHLIGDDGDGWSSRAIYTLAFFSFWVLAALASGLTVYLARRLPGETLGESLVPA